MNCEQIDKLIPLISEKICSDDKKTENIITDLSNIPCGAVLSTKVLSKLTEPTGKPVGFVLSSLAHILTSFSDFGSIGISLFENELRLLPSIPLDTSLKVTCATLV